MFRDGVHVIVECDEDQHGEGNKFSYPVESELRRMERVTWVWGLLDQGAVGLTPVDWREKPRTILFVRYNPDSCRINGEKRALPVVKREI